MSRVTLALALLLFVASAGWAATPTDTIQDVFAQADRLLTDPKTEQQPLERLLGIRKLVNEAFDFRGAAELASGEHWQARTVAEQEEFTWLFADLLERAFVARVAAKAKLTGGTRIRYLEESVENGSARVLTAMGRKDGRDLLLGYRLVDRGGAWKIRDVTIDGVSIMANYRAQLDRVLGTASFPELLTQMRAMVGTTEPLEAAAAIIGNTEPAAAPVIAEATPPVRTTPPVAVAPPVEATARVAAASPRAASPPADPKPAADVSRDVRPIAAAKPSPPVPPVAVAEVLRPDTAPAVKASRPASATIEPSRARRAPSASPRVLTTKAYWLRISTVTLAEAGRLLGRLRDDKHQVALERTSVSGKPMVQVSVGPFQDAAQAVAKLLDLQRKGHNPSLFAERH